MADFVIVIPQYLMLIAAIAFFAVLAEIRRDALYWFICLIFSIYLLVNRPEDSSVPIPVYVSWLFIVLYQAVSLLATGKAVNLSGQGDE